MEAGFPASSDGEWACVRAVAAELRRPVVAAMARAREADVDAAASALEPAVRSRVHIVLATSDVHLERKLLMTQAEILEADPQHRRVREREVRSGRVLLRGRLTHRSRVRRARVPGGSQRRRGCPGIPDTVGYAIPSEYAALIREVVTACPGVDVGLDHHDASGSRPRIPWRLSPRRTPGRVHDRTGSANVLAMLRSKKSSPRSRSTPAHSRRRGRP